jgi:serine/threonine-protein kinase
MQRFEREAQVLASLNHPNIAQIYGIESGAIVMELVAGEDLKGPVPLDTVLNYARQIAAGLEAAHEKGIVHRDLKPANIKVTPDGTVKLLDFGLAKAGEEAAAPRGTSPTMSPTLSLQMTQAGMILGTAAYMSPEQARGKPVDKRSDIWAFGVILYELLSGHGLFAGGETVTDIIAAVVTREPDLSQVPDRVRPLIRACLEKDPRERLRDIGDWRRLLTDAAPATTAAPHQPSRLPWIAAAVCALATIGLGVFAFAGRRAAPAPLAPLLRFEAESPVRAGLVLALSPDGSRILSSVPGTNSTTQLAIRSLDQAVATPIPGTENATDAVFSPDGEWIAFSNATKLFKVRLRGGVPIMLADNVNVRGIDWGDDDQLVFAPGIRHTILRVPASGGAPKEVTRFDASRKDATHRFPQLLPGGKTVIYTSSTRGGMYEDADIVATEIAGGRTTVLHHGGYHPLYIHGRDGHGFLAFFSQGVLYAMPMDPATLKLREPPIPLLQDVQSSNTGATAHIAFSRNGVVVYENGSGAETVVPVWFDTQGKSQRLNVAPGIYSLPRISPDGKKLLYMVAGGNPDIWIYDLASGNPSRLTFTGKVQGALWAPDSRHVFVWAGVIGKQMWLRADGSAPPHEFGNIGMRVTAFSPYGKHAVGEIGIGKQAMQVWENLSSDDPHPGTPQPLPEIAARRIGFCFSPDGKWLAYASEENGGSQIFVTSATAPGVKWQVSTDTGAGPEFSPRGGELFYVNPRGLIAVSYTVQGDAFVRGQEHVKTLDHDISQIFGAKNYSLAPDGKMVALISTSDHAGPAKLTFLVNFADELERRLAEGSAK